MAGRVRAYAELSSQLRDFVLPLRPNLSTQHIRYCESQSVHTSEIGLHKRGVLFAPKNRLRQLGNYNRGLLIGEL